LSAGLLAGLEASLRRPLSLKAARSAFSLLSTANPDEFLSALAMSSSSKPCPRPDTTEDIGFMRNHFQVLGIHAQMIPAEMVDNHAFGNRANEQLIRNPMRQSDLPVEPESTIRIVTT
jgi:hypothetical protein